MLHWKDAIKEKSTVSQGQDGREIDEACKCMRRPENCVYISSRESQIVALLLLVEV